MFYYLYYYLYIKNRKIKIKLILYIIGVGREGPDKAIPELTPNPSWVLKRISNLSKPIYLNFKLILLGA